MKKVSPNASQLYKQNIRFTKPIKYSRIRRTTAKEKSHRTAKDFPCARFLYLSAATGGCRHAIANR
ncbi:MAG: hypothetical protein UEU47_10210 [Oscillospiraceae bacterium]|nr:hypothetical protein [Oscillospiraceae bacterium]